MGEGNERGEKKKKIKTAKEMLNENGLCYGERQKKKNLGKCSRSFQIKRKLGEDVEGERGGERKDSTREKNALILFSMEGDA